MFRPRSTASSRECASCRSAISLNANYCPLCGERASESSPLEFHEHRIVHNETDDSSNVVSASTPVECFPKKERYWLWRIPFFLLLALSTIVVAYFWDGRRDFFLKRDQQLEEVGNELYEVLSQAEVISQSVHDSSINLREEYSQFAGDYNALDRWSEKNERYARFVDFSRAEYQNVVNLVRKLTAEIDKLREDAGDLNVISSESGDLSPTIVRLLDLLEVRVDLAQEYLRGLTVGYAADKRFGGETQTLESLRESFLWQPTYLATLTGLRASVEVICSQFVEILPYVVEGDSGMFRACNTATGRYPEDPWGY